MKSLLITVLLFLTGIAATVNTPTVRIPGNFVLVAMSDPLPSSILTVNLVYLGTPPLDRFATNPSQRRSDLASPIKSASGVLHSHFATGTSVAAPMDIPSLTLANNSAGRNWHDAYFPAAFRSGGSGHLESV